MGNDPEFWRQPTDPKHLTPGWYVVVERSEYDGTEIAPYVVGPYATEAEVSDELESDSGITYGLLTIDAKAEGYVAGGDCYYTETPPQVCVQIIPPKEGE